MAIADPRVAPGVPSTDALYNSTTSKTNGVSSKATQDGLKRSFAQYSIGEQAWDMSGSLTVGKLFHPSKHLVYEEPKYIHTMEDIGYPATNGVSPIAVSEPFRLFSEEAVDNMRAEVLDEEVQAKYSYTSDIAPKQIRGYAPKYGKFIFEAWKSPATLAIISKIAGVDLVPVMDYEIGHVNISMPGAKKEHDNSVIIADDDQKAVVGWHRDSYPFVCVLMMSDTTGMIGGETALKTGKGEIKKVRGPQKGCAIVLQGRYIDHQALRAFGGQERITMVTSFRPRSPLVRDDTVLTTVRPISNLSDLYGQTLEYQLENVEARIRHSLKRLRETMKAGHTDVPTIKAYLEFEIKALTNINKEIIEEDKVQKGALADICEVARAEAAAKHAKLE
jgi:hypothetical protein